MANTVQKSKLYKQTDGDILSLEILKMNGNFSDMYYDESQKHRHRKQWIIIILKSRIQRNFVEDQ